MHHCLANNNHKPSNFIKMSKVSFTPKLKMMNVLNRVIYYTHLIVNLPTELPECAADKTIFT